MYMVQITPVQDMKQHADLFAKHGEECPTGSGVNKVDVDFDTYEGLEKAGYLLCVTVSSEFDDIVGYMVVIAQPMTHHKGVFAASVDAVYVDSKHRNTCAFKTMMSFVESYLVEHGITTILFAVNTNYEKYASVEKSLLHAGYEVQDILYIKEL